MVLIAAGVLMQRRRGEILHDCATEADINDLHAFTDPENGKPVTDAQLKRCSCRMSSSVSMEREP